MYLIVGNFFGIQNYIFSNLKSKKSASILRGRSFDIYALMYIVSHKILKKYSLKDENLIFLNSGKFYIKSKEKLCLKDIQNEIDSFFLENFLTDSGIYLFIIKIENDFSKTLEKINHEKELKSFQKFSLWDKSPFLDGEYKIKALKNGICEQCEIRVKENESDFCEVCNNHSKIGNDLRKKAKIINIRSLFYNLEKDEKDKSLEKFIPYVPKSNNEIKSFDEIADNSENLLIALKADIDSLGKNFFSKNTLEDYINLSKELDGFMTIKLKELIKEKNIYTVFSGGDDLFLIGEFNDILEFIPKFKKEFDSFAKINLPNSSISISTEVIKNSTPIKYIVETLEKNLIKIKKQKDSIYIFNQKLSFNQYEKSLIYIENEFKRYEKTINRTTSFYYNLLEIINKKIALDRKENIIENSMWASNLSYFFKRNIIDKVHKTQRENSEKFLEFIYKAILKDSEVFLVFIQKSIYQKRMKNEK
ncbi:Cas10/Cmr2 second palm domain-containing protein [Malaciobacter sp. WC5094]